MIFNTSGSAYYPLGIETANKRCNQIALQLMTKVEEFFSNVGVDKKFSVPEMDILNRSSNLSTGKADVRCVICEIAENISNTDILLKIASLTASAGNFSTRKSDARKPEHKRYHGALEFLKQVEILFLSIGIQPEQISKNVYNTVILYSRLILIRLWREGLVVLPITVDFELNTNKFDEFTKFKTSNHRSKPPMFGASENYCEQLKVEFTQVLTDIQSAPTLEFNLIKYEGGKYYRKCSSILYCSTLKSPGDISIDCYDDLVRLFCLYDTYDSTNPHDAILLKELSNDTKPFKLAKTAFETFRTAATKLGCHKKDSLTGHTHSVTRAYRAELLLLNSAIDFNFDEVIYEQDEQMLFEFFADNDYKATQKFYSLGIIDEPDYNAWNMYKDKHLNSVTKPSFSNAKWGWNVIYQYLAYVSCWCEMFQEQSIEGCISTPATFKELDRETFVIRSYSNQDIDTDQWPRTLGEFLLHKSASVATWVKTALDSVEVNFAFDEDHISSTGKLLLPTEFTNHWHKANNGIQLGTLTESVKRVFTRPEYAVSLSVAYTLEMYGAYLQERVLEGYDYNLLGFRPAMSFHTDNQYRLIEIGPKIRTPAGIVKYQHNSPVNAEKKLIADAFYWAVPLEHYQDVIRVGENNTMALKREINSHVCAGFSPIVWYVNDELTDAYVRLDNTSKIIGNPFSMTNFGTIDIEDTQIVAPLLGPIRGIIVALEQGIRHKHIRYLDKRYFDQYVTEDLVQLLVSTDKSRRQPWKAISHLDVISMLRAERQFQDLRTDIDHLINYNNDGREIDVLFRNASGEAFTETAWSDVWRIFLSISQGVINSSFTNTIDRCEFVKMVPLSETGSMTSQTVERLITADSEFVKRAKVSGKNEKLKFDADGHRVKLLALLTPHSTRTTYVSHRVGYIGLETVRKNIGQIKVFSTVYYNKETDEERARKILEYRSGHSLQVHKPTNNDTSRMRTNDVSQTHVQGAFQENPRETMMVYGFTSIPIVTVDDEGNEITNPTGMDLVESTPLSLIAFAPTHICIHNMECTSKIITENGGYQRCGVCRIKICHIDNLISISRMVQRYELDLKANVTAIIRLNRSKVDDATVHKIEIAQLKREQSILQSELLGWQTALHIIEQTRVRLLNKKHTSRFIVPAPRLLSTTISCKKLSQSVPELFLDHVTNMSDIPSLNSPEVAKTVAKIEKRILLESKNASKDVMREVEACFVSDSLDPRHIMSPIMSMLDAKIITKEQILQVIDNELSPPTLKRSPLQNTVMEALTANG